MPENLTVREPTEAQLTITYGSEVEVATALRTAFAFIRAHDDRRYSATVKLALLTHADRIEAAGADYCREHQAENPVVGLLTSPFSFDEETEVKSGGNLGCFVVFPDGKTLLAVNNTQRRKGIGSMLLRYAVDYSDRQLRVWIHRENQPGMSFAVARELLPFDINRQGAVMFAIGQPREEEADAVAYMDDSEIDIRLRGGRRRPGRFDMPAAAAPRRRPDVARGFDYQCEFSRFEGYSVRDIWRSNRGFLGFIWHLWNEVPLMDAHRGVERLWNAIAYLRNDNVEVYDYLQSPRARRDYEQWGNREVSSSERRQLGMPTSVSEEALQEVAPAGFTYVGAAEGSRLDFSLASTPSRVTLTQAQDTVREMQELMIQEEDRQRRSAALREWTAAATVWDDEGPEEAPDESAW